MERKEADVHVRLSSSERMALEKLAATRGTNLSKMVRGTLAEICIMSGMLPDPAANNAGEHCAVCESMAARPVELPNGTTLRLCANCAPLFVGASGNNHGMPERLSTGARGRRVLSPIGEGA